MKFFRKGLTAIALILVQPGMQRAPIPSKPPTEIEKLQGEVEELRNDLIALRIRVRKLENPDFNVQPTVDGRRLEQVRYKTKEATWAQKSYSTK